MAWTSRVDTVPSLQTLLQDEDEDSSSDVSVASEQSGEDMPPQSDSSYDSNEDTDDEESEESSSSESDSAARGPAAGRTWGAAQGEAVGRGQLQAAQPSPAFIKSPSGEIWMTDAPQANVVTERPGPRNLGGASSILQLFHLFISTAMMDAILLHTNEEGRRQRGNAWKDLVPMELSSAVGLLLFLGLTKSGRENVRSIWRKGPFARNLCIATMSGMRFQDILAMLRFDDKATGCQRRQNDMFAPIREIFDQFAASCRRYYSAGECVTVGEQLVPFRGRCPFWQCRPQKPVKYGIKFWLCVDIDTHYTLNIMPYLGKAGD
ncbi:uncharacterized protein LOC110984162 [Acanthaster planci]|uniref:Uncharacterized protein LOC110984162 n=1 Tax=Acanthaster planci TaxID=133434 RepID=A0A8B7Z293_ACAPL|nr:uncharacterized protein LOC110984162 [Acanthaster planci]